MNNCHANQLKYNNFLSRIAVIVVLGWALALSPGRNATAQEGLRIAAVVNDEAISILDLESRIVMAIASSNVKDGRETRRRMAPSMLRNLIDERLMQQEIRRLDIKVTQHSHLHMLGGFNVAVIHISAGVVDLVVISQGGTHTDGQTTLRQAVEDG